jgi:hypothetical protein
VSFQLQDLRLKTADLLVRQTRGAQFHDGQEAVCALSQEPGRRRAGAGWLQSCDDWRRALRLADEVGKPVGTGTEMGELAPLVSAGSLAV